jgi:hypothetical protein
MLAAIQPSNHLANSPDNQTPSQQASHTHAKTESGTVGSWLCVPPVLDVPAEGILGLLAKQMGKCKFTLLSDVFHIMFTWWARDAEPVPKATVGPVLGPGLQYVQTIWNEYDSEFPFFLRLFHIISKFWSHVWPRYLDVSPKGHSSVVLLSHHVIPISLYIHGLGALCIAYSPNQWKCSQPCSSQLSCPEQFACLFARKPPGSRINWMFATHPPRWSYLQGEGRGGEWG